MVKKVTHPVPHEELVRERTETHLQLFARLAKITNMHGHPGPRKPKKAGK